MINTCRIGGRLDRFDYFIIIRSVAVLLSTLRTAAAARIISSYRETFLESRYTLHELRLRAYVLLRLIRLYSQVQARHLFSSLHLPTFNIHLRIRMSMWTFRHQTLECVMYSYSYSYSYNTRKSYLVCSAIMFHITSIASIPIHCRYRRYRFRFAR